jgi:hypothetical protein
MLHLKIFSFYVSNFIISIAFFIQFTKINLICATKYRCYNGRNGTREGQEISPSYSRLDSYKIKFKPLFYPYITLYIKSSIVENLEDLNFN